jgi:CheY-like chemotaxis protein
MRSLKRFSDVSVLASGELALIVDLPVVVDNLDLSKPQMPVPRGTTIKPLVAMVADDSPSARHLLTELLEQWGFQVRASRDGCEALQDYAECQPDLLIVDLEMPRLGGLGFLARVKGSSAISRIPIIVVSHRDRRSEKEAATSLGVSGFLVKPFSAEQLHRAIEAAGLRLPDLTIA